MNNSTLDLKPVAGDYLAALVSLDKSTEELLTAIRASDMNGIAVQMQERTKACEIASKCASRLADTLTGKEESDPELSAMLGELTEREQQIIDKQKECESVLTNELEECRTDLLELYCGSRVMKAYRGQGNTEQQAKFLDSRL